MGPIREEKLRLPAILVIKIADENVCDRSNVRLAFVDDRTEWNEATDAW